MPMPELNRRHLIRSRCLPLGGALAIALVCTGWSGEAGAHGKPSAAVTALDNAGPAQAILAGEAALRKSPRDAAIRAALGRAYLRGGRFESAATVLNDAVTLGDNAPRTLLSLALARIAIGQQGEAQTLLQTAQGSLPVADFGLALALAGDPSHGITLMAESARAGQSSEKLRQNLAYAYALDGRWGEARTIVAMDLPADKVDARLTQWAASAKPEAVRERVAALLGAPVVGDVGLPATLALNGDSREKLAVKAPAAMPMPAAVPTPMPAAPEKELPALAAEPAPAAEPARTMMATAEAPAFKPVAPQGVVEPATTWSPVSRPVASPLRVAYEAPKVRTPKPRVEKSVTRVAVKVAAKARVEEAPAGTHLVQLGAFTTAANAERARKLALARGGKLGGAHDVVITKAVVNGRDFWRVAATGFSSASATGACGRVKKAGGACFAYENGHLPAGQALAMAAPVRKH